MKIKLNHCADMGDWYTIVRAEHDGLNWFERTGSNSQRLMTSERLCPEYCIEGSAEEMIAVATAIHRRGKAHFTRVSVRFAEDGAHLCSPRNSERDAVVTLEEADELAVQILAELTPNV